MPPIELGSVAPVVVVVVVGVGAGCGRRGAGCARRGDRRENAAHAVVRQIQAVLLRAVAIDLEDLDVEHDLGLGLVGLLNRLLDDVHHGRRRAHGDRVGGLVREDDRVDDAAAREPHEGREALRELGHVHVGDIKRPDDLLVVRQMLLGRVLEDEDRSVVDDLVRQHVLRHQHVERLLQREAIDVDGHRAIDDPRALGVAVVGDVDAAGVGNAGQDAADARVGEMEHEGLARRRIEERGRGGGARARAQFVHRPGPGGFDARADLLIERGDLQRGEAVAGVVLTSEFVLAARGFELVVIFVVLGAIEVLPRGDEHRALQRDLVIGILGRRLDGRAVVGDRLVEVARFDRGVPLPERLARCTPGGRDRRQQHTEPHQPSRHRCLKSSIPIVRSGESSGARAHRGTRCRSIPRRSARFYIARALFRPRPHVRADRCRPRAARSSARSPFRCSR